MYVLTALNGVCPAKTDSVFLQAPVPGFVSISTNDSAGCVGDTLMVIASASSGVLSWPGFSGNGSQLPVYDSDTIVCLLTDTLGCEFSSNTIFLSFSPIPDLQLSGDTIICLGDSLSLYATSANAFNPVWISPLGDTLFTDTYIVQSPVAGDFGTYMAFISSDGCTSSATWTVVQDSCSKIDFDIVVPNVFTPNGDDINDLFTVNLPPGEDGTLLVLNRWGAEIFTGPISKGWNGRNMRRIDEPEGVYYFILVPDQNAAWERITGFVHLMR
jgi:gliding motility-associated-like protein